MGKAGSTSVNPAGNAQIKKVGHTTGQFYGTNGDTAQAPLKNSPKEIKLKS